jgi:hypothetical protein
MLVQRRTYVVKVGCMPEIVAMLKAARERRKDNPVRVYTPTVPSIAPPGILAVEWEFESLQEYEKAWTDFIASPETAKFMERWNELTESGGTNELWKLET